MPHQSQAVEAMKTAKEARLATLGRAIADAAARGDRLDGLVREAALRRAQEQQRSNRQIEFAALVRQIGDAYAASRDYTSLIDRLVDLRRAELGCTRPAGSPFPQGQSDTDASQ